MNSLKFYKLFLYKFITTTTPPGKSRDKTAKLFFSLLFLKYERRKSRHKAVKDSGAGLAEADSHKQLWRFIFLREKSKIDTKCPSDFWCLIVIVNFKRSWEFYLVIGIPAQSRCKMPMGFLPVWEILSETFQSKDLQSSLLILICSKDSRAGLIEGRRKFPQAMTTLKRAEILNKGQQ